MWGLFAGIFIGVLQVLALNKLGGMIFGDKKILMFIAGVLLLVKMAVIVLMLYLISTISFEHLIWTAGGILIGLIAVSAYILRRPKKTDREDSSDG